MWIIFLLQLYIQTIGIYPHFPHKTTKKREMRKDKFLRINLYFLLLLMLSLEVFILDVTTQELPAIAKPRCQSKCGNVAIPYPFGMEKDCYLNDHFKINCSLSSDGNTKTPFLINTTVSLEILSISIGGTMRVNHSVFRTCQQGETSKDYNGKAADLEKTPFFFSRAKNLFTGLGCSNVVYMSDSRDMSYIYGGCLSLCDKQVNSSKTKNKNNDDTNRKEGHSGCVGINCCQTRIPPSLKSFNVTISLYKASSSAQNTSISEQKNWRYAFLVEQNWTYNPLAKLPTSMPMVLDWGVDQPSVLHFTKYKRVFCINNTLYSSDEYGILNCACQAGYEGNPYIENGCVDINECQINPPICGSRMRCSNTIGNFSCISHKVYIEAVFTGVGTSFAGWFLPAVAWRTYKTIKLRKVIKRTKKFFKRNGGLLLEKQLISSGDKVDRCKLFRSNELDKATDDFNKNRILGQGGQGTVYKGMLADGQIIAVKKSKVIDEVKLEEFVNEVDILSQINHINVVKLLGCCLETEVPLLVYEFIPNGTLYTYIHNPNEEIEFTWDMRLRIATEVAEALSYLHSAASIPIYHRNIKSTNILLDEMLRAKVADFGTSKPFAIDQTHVTTKVLETVGYIDPEYFQSNQFTEKSDVYSFGVVLVELLTGESPMRQGKCESLVSYFSDSMKEDRLNDILDAQVQSSGKKEEIMTIASLAQRCLNLNGKKRPTMKEVARVLEKTRASQKGSKLDEDLCEEIECVKSEITESWDMFTSSMSSSFAIDGPSMISH